MKPALEIIDEFELIGVPFDWKGRDYKKSLDCYGLAKFIYNKQGVNVPEYATPSRRESKGFVLAMSNQNQFWKKTDSHDEGMLAVFRTCSYLHVGYMLGNGKFIHTWDKSGGVCIENVADWKTRIEAVYEYIGD